MDNNEKQEDELWVTEHLDAYLSGSGVPLSSDTLLSKSSNINLRAVNHSIYETFGNADSMEMLMKFDEIYRIVWSLENYKNIGQLYEFVHSLKSYKNKECLSFVFRIFKVKEVSGILKDELNELEGSILKSSNNSLINEKQKDKELKLKNDLNNYGFFQLEKVKEIQNLEKLVELISNNDTPYKIALFDHLGFLEHLRIIYAKKCQVGDRNLIVSKMLGVNEHTVKNNINNLDRPHKRYTSFLHKKAVMNDCKRL